MRSAKTPASAQKRRRAPKVACTALITLDTARIREAHFKSYCREKKTLEKLELERRSYNEADEPAFRQFIAAHFGAELTREREIMCYIAQATSRQEKIAYGAYIKRMTQGRYCYFLSTKLKKDVDFWAELDRHVAMLAEEERKREEECQRRFAEEAEGDEYDDDEDDDFEWMDKEFRRVFGHVWDAIVLDNDIEPVLKNEQKDLKRLYRELCIRYHPDKIGTHDAHMQKLWLDIQDAYAEGNMGRLRTIHAGIQIESGKQELSCSDLWRLIDELKRSILEIRRELRYVKARPSWGFCTWSEQKKKRALREIKKEFDDQYAFNKKQLEYLQNALEAIRTSYRPKR